MREWIRVALVAASVGCVSTLLLLLLWRFYQLRKRGNFVEPASLTRMEGGLQGGLSRIHNHHHHHQLDHQGSSNKNKQGNYFVIRGGVSGKRVLFSWSDHPSMAADAVENGWSRFSFIASKTYTPSPSKRSSILGVCAAPVSDDHHGTESEVEISWEISQGSAEFMQKVRFNPGLKKILQYNNNNNSSSSMNVASVIRTALPLPGPPLGNYSFPQEAYFEITILYGGGGNEYEFAGKNVGEGEKTKLLVIQGGGGNGSKGNSEALVHVSSNNHSKNSVDEMKLDGKEGGKRNESVMFSLGLTAAGPVPLRVPGSYPASIGFNSNGSVFLDGMKLVFESEKAEWVGTDKVIGCGFDPRQKKVFFTLDSELVHVIHCQSQVFGTPLYPIMAANIDIMVLVNFGQSSFKYAPANAQRTPNPCFIAPLVNSPAATLGYDDSRELFSMGRIDSQWRNRSATRGSHNNGNNNMNHNNNNNNSNIRTVEFDEESEADLFEIVLDGSGKSPNSAS
ncbi:hypothetical protein HN51_018834 [Arachis hypogaea]|uniref:B30.2/SPRY domain-containing protein n=1 Tax=Arachis hypogaea TaxID=3818 RepID=A0A444WPI2_ARAHY|nr:uncharacterized protein LOC112765302 [Arachis hypogaea]QHO30469.1 hypothetical protein DS421_8g233500 [Arachis hypogaea]RYQ79112.1 hypothetical protein Ahy_Scaffold7g108311 [Arachis hypogaea]